MVWYDMESLHWSTGQLLIYFLTRSRMVIQILKRFGACISYDVAGECETEIVYAASEKSRLLPDGLHELEDLNTG